MLLLEALTEKTRDALLAAGWTPERTVDVSGLKADIEYWGYHWNGHAEAFFKRFAFLRPGYADFDFISRDIDFGYDSERLAYIAEVIGQSLCPLGYCDEQNTGLLMAEDGSVYWAIDGDHGFLADTYVEALNKTFARERGHWFCDD